MVGDVVSVAVAERLTEAVGGESVEDRVAVRVGVGGGVRVAVRVPEPEEVKERECVGVLECVADTDGVGGGVRVSDAVGVATLGELDHERVPDELWL